jgi:hypothetical protein
MTAGVAVSVQAILARSLQQHLATPSLGRASRELAVGVVRMVPRPACGTMTRV